MVSILVGNRMANQKSPSSSESWESELKTAIGAGPSTGRLIESIRLLAPLHQHVLIVGEIGSGHRDVARALIRAGELNDENPSVYMCEQAPEPIVTFLNRSLQIGSSTQGNAHEECEEAIAPGQPRSVIQIERLETLDRLGQHQLLQWLRSHGSMAGNHSQRSFESGHRVCESEPTRSRSQLLFLAGADIDSRVRDRTFDPELFYAIHALRLDLVPLRERKQEIPDLVRACLERSSERLGRASPRITADAIKALTDYSWPGNLLELQSIVDRMVALCDSPSLHRNDLLALLESRTSEAMAAAGEDFDSLVRVLVRLGLQRAPKDATNLQDQIVAQVEKELISQVLSDCDQVQIKAAIRLGMNRNTLHKKMKAFGLDETMEAEDKSQ